MVNIGAIFGRGGNKEERKEESSHQEQSETHESSSSSQKQTIESSSSEDKSTTTISEVGKQVDFSKADLERIANLGNSEEGVFERAKHATREAEQAAKLASAEAERAFRLLADGETAKKQVESIRTKHEQIKEKLEDTKIADIEAKAKKDELADLKASLKQKGEFFDTSRGQARTLADQVKQKSSVLETQKAELCSIQADQAKAKDNADHLRNHLKEAEAKKPEQDNAARAAIKLVETEGDNIAKLQKELNDADKLAADLERQAREARQKANAKKAELANANEKRTTVTKDSDYKKGIVADLEKRINDLKQKLGDQDKNITELGTRQNGKKSEVDQLVAELEKLKKDAEAKNDETRSKRKEYEDLENRLKTLEKEALDAATAQKQALQTRQVLEKEFFSYSKELETSESRLSASTEEAKAALLSAKKAEAKKHELLDIAKKASEEADKLTHKKIATVDDVLSDKLQSLDDQSKVVTQSAQSTVKETSRMIKSGTSVDKEGPATPDLTKQATQDAEEAKRIATKSTTSAAQSSTLTQKAAQDAASAQKIAGQPCKNETSSSTQSTGKKTEALEESAQKVVKGKILDTN